MKKRLGIFMCYDARGIIDDYIIYLLKQIRLTLSELIIVCNTEGAGLDSSSLRKLKVFANKVVLRDNSGYDVAAWQQAIVKEVGVDNLGQYDELVLFNDSFFGPFKPFAEIFATMDKRRSANGQELDFWGLSVHGQTPNIFGLCPYGYRPRYLQTYFLVFKKRLITSPEFADYWCNLPQFNSSEELSELFAAVLTKHFGDLGYAWDAYTNTGDLEGEPEKNLSHHSFNTYEMVVRRGFPIIKRKSFLFQKSTHLIYGDASGLRRSLEYIQKNTSYDTGLIYRYLLSHMHLDDLHNILNLDYVFSKYSRNSKICEQSALANASRNESNEQSAAKNANVNENSVQSALANSSRNESNEQSASVVTLVGENNEQSAHKQSACVIAHLYYPELFERCCEYLLKIPEGIDVVITTDCDQKRERILEILAAEFAVRQCSNLDVRVVKKRGRDLAALLVGCADVLSSYEYICFIHDKMSTQVEYPTVGMSFFERMWESMLASTVYIQNILDFLHLNPSVGLMSPPNVYHGTYFETSIDFWTINYEETLKLAKELKLSVPMARNHQPIALGSVFWCRSQALMPLFARKWSYEDFPAEPMPVDGTVSHALERILPFVAQAQGYLSVTAYSEGLAAAEIVNKDYMLHVLLEGLREQTEEPFVNFAFANASVRSKTLFGGTVTSTEIVQPEIQPQIRNELRQIFLKYKKTDYDSLCVSLQNPLLTCHLSSSRGNIVRWLPLSDDARVLELDAGFGSITQALLQRTENVMSCDPDATTNEVNRLRNGEHLKFDTLTGMTRDVLARLLTKAATEFELIMFSKPMNYYAHDEVIERLQLAMQLLSDKDNLPARIVLFFQYRNEHSQIVYEHDKLMQSLHDVFRAQLKIQGYHLNSGYMFANEIISYSYSLGYEVPAECERGHLLVLSKANDLADNTLPIYCKIANERAEDFRVMTIIKQDDNDMRSVTKYPLELKAKAHVEKIIKSANLLDNQYGALGFTANKSWLCNGGVRLEYVKGQSLISRLCVHLRNKDFAVAMRELSPLLDAIRSSATVPFVTSPEFVEVFGESVLLKQSDFGLKSAAFTDLDLIPANIINVGTNKWVILDYEWSFDFPIPAEFIVYRCLLYSVMELKELSYKEGQSLLQELCETANVPMQLISEFERMEASFQDWIVGQNKSRRLVMHRPFYWLGRVIVPEGRDDVTPNQVHPKIRMRHEIDNLTLDDLVMVANSYYEVKDSTSWRITAPLRKLMQILKGRY
ncbi:MAG: rhamnan synthesis F family protein [Coriobacteriales bacterium]|nr:rhamnan synthesis F family protein [Coriobacteriales bacterium]